MARKKNPTPGAWTVLLLGTLAGAGYYYGVYKPQEEAKKKKKDKPKELPPPPEDDDDPVVEPEEPAVVMVRDNTALEIAQDEIPAGTPYLALASMRKGSVYERVRSMFEKAAQEYEGQVVFLDIAMGNILKELSGGAFEPKSDVVAVIGGAWQRPGECVDWLMGMAPPDAQEQLEANDETQSFQFDCEFRMLVDANNIPEIASSIEDAISAAKDFGEPPVAEPPPEPPPFQGHIGEA